jgi:hypothetical protein
MSLYWAERAVAYVRTTVGMLSNNRDADTARGTANVSGARIESFSRRSEASSDEHVAMGAEVSAFIEYQAGNCDEMAKVSFVWLAQHDEVRPLELANFSAAAAMRVRFAGLRTEDDVEPDHTFVIIGRQMGNAERLERQQGVISLPAYESWNFGAVICDPWARRFYMASRLAIESQMINRVTAGRTQLSSDLRLEVGEKWRGPKLS